MTNRPRLHAFALTALASCLLLAACGDSGASSPSSDQLAVVATTTQIGDFARVVGGDAVKVTQLLKPNSDPHEYEPTPADVQAVTDADVVLEHGIGLDEWLDGVLTNAGGDATRVVTTTGISVRPGSGDEPGDDPHVWLDPRNAVAMVQAIRTALADAAPDRAATFTTNADAYVAEINALDAELSQRIAAIPSKERVIVTDHDAFGYFAARYDIDIVGTVIPSVSTAADPSAKALTDLAATIRDRGVRVIFSEASIDPRLEKTLADEVGIRLGAPLFGDALGPAGSPGGTYLGMMRSNMDAIIAGITNG